MGGRVVLDRDAPRMGNDDLLDDRQPQTTAIALGIEGTRLGARGWAGLGIELIDSIDSLGLEDELGARFHFGAGGIGSVKAFENMGQGLLWEARSVVNHIQNHMAAETILQGRGCNRWHSSIQGRRDNPRSQIRLGA
jgi:hypothetical protein